VLTHASQPVLVSTLSSSVKKDASQQGQLAALRLEFSPNRTEFGACGEQGAAISPEATQGTGERIRTETITIRAGQCKEGGEGNDAASAFGEARINFSSPN